MKVGFLLPSSFNKGSGIWRKVLLQAEHLRSLGARTLIFSFSGEGSDQLPDHVHLPLEQGGRGSKEKQLRRLITKASEAAVDLVYLRRELWHPSFRALMRSIPTVAEINAREAGEFKLTLSLPRRLYAWLTRAAWAKYPAGFVSVTHEIAADAPPHKPQVVISNGIDHFDPLPPVSAQAVPHLFFSATGGFAWHGIDKFVLLAKLFPDWKFTFVGDLPAGWKSASTPPNLRAHGRLTAGEADRLLEDANIGVGSIAVDRKGMEEACPLKVRTYLARGLPTIIGYKDTDFSRGFPFICQLPNIEDNIGREKNRIEAFVTDWFRRRVPPEELKFAAESEKAKARLQFFEQIVSAGKTPAS